MLSPLSAKLSWLFLLTGCLKALSTLTYTCTCKEQWISGQDDFSMSVSMRKVAEQILIKMTFSYNILRNILS